MWNYSNISVETTLTATVSAGDTAIPIGSTAGLPVSFPYTVVLDFAGSNAEVVTVTNLTGSTLTVTRGQDGTTAQSHNLGAKVVHAVVARDLREPQQHIAASGDVHGVGGASNVVGTSTVQTLTGKTISGGANTLTNIPAANLTGPANDLVTQASGVNAVPLTVKAVNGQVADRARFENHLGVSPTRVNAAGELVAEQVRTLGTLNVDGAVTATGALTTSGAVTATTVNASNQVVSTRAGASDSAYRAAVSGDGNDRLLVRADGLHAWGPGNAAQDVTLYRSAPNVLKTDDAFEAASLTVAGAASVGGNLSVTGNLDVTGVGRLLLAHKTADTPRNNTTTLTADPNLSVTVVANAVYLAELSAAWFAPGTSDINFDFAVPAAATFNSWRFISNGTASVWTGVQATAATFLFQAGGTESAFSATGVLVTGANGGPFALRWAPNFSEVAQTFVRAGSWLRLIRIA